MDLFVGPIHGLYMARVQRAASPHKVQLIRQSLLQQDTQLHSELLQYSQLFLLAFSSPENRDDLCFFIGFQQDLLVAQGRSDHYVWL